MVFEYSENMRLAQETLQNIKRAILMLPIRQFELTNQYDLGGDGKCYYGYHPNEEWFLRVMRK